MRAQLDTHVYRSLTLLWGSSFSAFPPFPSLSVPWRAQELAAAAARVRKPALSLLSARLPTCAYSQAFSASFAIVGAPPFLYTSDVSERGRSREWRQGIPVRYEDVTAARVTG